jgi:hypothetical protein
MLAILDKLPPSGSSRHCRRYAEWIQTVFVIAAPIAGIACLVSWLIPQVELGKEAAYLRGPDRTPRPRPIHAGGA